MAMIGSTYGGIWLSGDHNVVGGTTALARNVLPNDSITVNGNSNTVEGNYVGVDVTGLNHIGTNAGIGVGGANNIIGGLTDDGSGGAAPGTGAGNVVGNSQQDAIQLYGSAATGNVVEGNLIGTDKTGLTAARNVRASVALIQERTATRSAAPLPRRGTSSRAGPTAS